MSDTRSLEQLQQLLADASFHLEGREPDNELRESMKAHGWSPRFPALVDEEGNVLSGHRRMAVAKELGIEPVTEVVRFGDPAEAVRMTLIANVGGKPWTQAQRRKVAEYLYGAQGWTQVKIAEALNVSQATVSRELSTVNKSPGRGRPRKPESSSAKPTPRAEKRPKGEALAALNAAFESGSEPEPNEPAASPNLALESFVRLTGVLNDIKISSFPEDTSENMQAAWKDLENALARKVNAIRRRASQMSGESELDAWIGRQVAASDDPMPPVPPDVSGEQQTALRSLFASMRARAVGGEGRLTRALAAKVEAGQESLPMDGEDR